MKQSLRKGASILLTLCMILTLMPQYAYAGGESIVQRTAKLPLGDSSEQFGYTNTADVLVDSVSADDKITDSAEGWEWYPAGDSTQDYAVNTLVLKGINLETYNPVAISLPAGATIILKTDTTNVVRSTCSQVPNNVIGIDCKGELSIKGDGSLEVQSGIGPYLNTSTAISAAGNLNIEGGTIRALGQVAFYGSTGLFSAGVVKISGGNITAKSDTTMDSNISAAIKGASVIIEDGTVYAQASLTHSVRYSILSDDGDGIETGIVTTGMVVRYNIDDNNYTGQIELHRTEDNKMYYSMVGASEEHDENAFDILIQKAPPGASISEKTISGVAGSKISGTPTMTISLTGCTFIELANNTDISNWFTNLPDGLIVTLLSVESDGSSVSIGFSGTPIEASNSVMVINIPRENLSIDEQVTVDTNSNAKFAITGGESQKRTNSLDLTVTELSYKASGSAEPAYANPSISNITNTVEGWKWYRYADEERGYSANTLELSGIDLTTTALVGIKLPVSATIIISDNTTNTVKSIYVPDGSFIPGGDFTYGIHCLGDLSIQGDTGSLAVSSGNPSTGDTSGVMAAGSLTVDGGSITAIGGVTSTAYQKMSTGIRAVNKITITGGTIYAKTDYDAKSRPVFSEAFKLRLDGMEAYQKDSEMEVYTIPARTYNGVFVYAKGQYANLSASDVKITPMPLASFEGKGTEVNPYLITSKEELKEMARYVNEYNSKYGNKNYKLMADIVLNEAGNGTLEQWAPIGLNSDQPFSGIFDGGNHSIKGIFINDFTTSYAGLFGYIKDGIVKNVSTKGGEVSALGSNSYAGGIAGYNNGGQIEDCFNTASIVATQSGGITGYNEMGHIQDSYNTGNVAGFVAGGIAGVNQDAELTIVNCYNLGSVKAMKNNDSVYAGGITGKNYSATIKNSYNA
ncbi:MAG: Peptidoglycan-binding lysin domain protein, partial [Bacillota bacterium]|nr:Peptidoglycan-binding lysin domain protein [Bacillota bacterium]